MSEQLQDRIHWRTKIQVQLDWSKSSLPASSPLNKLGTSYTLRSVQSIDPVVNTPVDVNDSIETERNGFTIKPGRIVLALTTLAAAPLDEKGQPTYSDSAILSMLQWARAIIDITVSHAGGNDDFGQSIALLDCMINGGNPMQLNIDAKPTSTFNLHVLGAVAELTGENSGSLITGSKYSF